MPFKIQKCERALHVPVKLPCRRQLRGHINLNKQDRSAAAPSAKMILLEFVFCISACSRSLFWFSREASVLPLESCEMSIKCGLMTTDWPQLHLWWGSSTAGQTLSHEIMKGPLVGSQRYILGAHKQMNKHEQNTNIEADQRWAKPDFSFLNT